MAASLDDIKAVRSHFTDLIAKNLPIFEEMKTRMDTLAVSVSTDVESFLQTDYVAYNVGQTLDKPMKPVLKLQEVRRAIYANAKYVSRFRTDLFSKMYSIHADAKSFYTALFTEITGDELTMTYLQSNADKEREAYYLLKDITSILDSIKTTYTTTRNNVDWMTENLDQLNKIESALRLEHNMKLTLNDVGDTRSDEMGSTEGVDLQDLMDKDLKTKPVSTPKGTSAVMNADYDPLVDDESLEQHPDSEFQTMSEDDIA